MDTLDGFMIKKETKRRLGAFWPYVFSLSITSACFINLALYKDVPVWFWVYGAVVIVWSVIKLIQGRKIKNIAR